MSITYVMPENCFETNGIQKTYGKFRNDTCSNAKLESLVGAPGGIVLQRERAQGSVATALASQGDPAGEFHKGFRGSIRAIHEATCSDDKSFA